MVICRCVSGCSMWARPQTSPGSNDGLMHAACVKGHLSVCQWLFEVGASADITRADNDGFTPMYAACMKGHLSGQWLFEVGVRRHHQGEQSWSPDVRCLHERSSVSVSVVVRCARPQTSPGQTTMASFDARCLRERSSVMCQWLFEVGASADITRRTMMAPLMWIVC